MSLVSIIIPVYNVEKYIRRCLISIQSQTMTDIEIIVVNDGTTDNSMNTVHELAKDDQRIKILNHEMNMGLMWTRRTGYMAATGDYITFCDSDDYLPPNALKILYDEAKRTGADIVSGNNIHVSPDGSEQTMRVHLPYGTDRKGVYKAMLCGDLWHSLCDKIFRASLLQNHNYQTFAHVTNGEDACLLYQIIANIDKMVLIPEAVYCYVDNDGSSTRRRLSRQALRSICIAQRIKIDMVSDCPELNEDLNRNVCNVLCTLYLNGYNSKGVLSREIHDNGLEHYISIKKIFRYLSVKRILRTLIAYIIHRWQSLFVDLWDKIKNQ